ncbi:hypothetical protein Hdeb2414_s0010g00343821 [Helianthus debilis subsp. tardiflorus]
MFLSQRERCGGCRGCEKVVVLGGERGVVVVAGGGAWRDGDDVSFVDLCKSSLLLAVVIAVVVLAVALLFIKFVSRLW